MTITSIGNKVFKIAIILIILLAVYYLGKYMKWWSKEYYYFVDYCSPNADEGDSCYFTDKTYQCYKTLDEDRDIITKCDYVNTPRSGKCNYKNICTRYGN